MIDQPFLQLNRIIALVLLCLFLSNNVTAFNVVYGTIKDKQTGEVIIGAIVFNTENNYTVNTNNYGFYSLKISIGCSKLNISGVGYKTEQKSICVNNDTLINILLEPAVTEIYEVIVISGHDNVSSVNTGVSKIFPNKIKAIPSMTGSPDVLKSLQLLPGVQATNEGTTNMNIRGGSFDQNLILLDEAPVYNPSHALGFYSTFNTDAIKSVTMYKGCYPARYGGRLSSVLDLTMKEGNNQKFVANASIGLTASQLTLEGPIFNDKCSFLLSGRYSYTGSALKALTIMPVITTNLNGREKINFYDLNLKINYSLNDKNRFYISNYSGSDLFSSYIINGNNELQWGNQTTTLRWNHVYSSRLFSNFTAYYSSYKYQNTDDNQYQGYYWKSGITEIGLKDDFSNYQSPNSIWRFGITAINRSFIPGSILPSSGALVDTSFSLQTLYNDELAAYLENELKLTNDLSILAGIRTSVFTTIGPNKRYISGPGNNAIVDTIVTPTGSISSSYYSIEPRITFHYSINENNSIKVGFAHTVQNIHLLSNSSLGMPYDVWMPANDAVKPQNANQFVTGYYTNLKQKTIVASMELYYNQLNNIIDFKDNANLFFNNAIDSEILSGRGKSYGIEAMIEKPFGKLYGWISYTLSKTQYKINGINKDEWFSPHYDIRHNLSIVGFYDFNKRWSFSSTFKLTSGGFITFPERFFRFDGAVFPLYSSRNNYQLPAYHRLDISATYRGKRNDVRKWKSEWVFSLYNAYGHKNIFALFVRQNMDSGQGSRVYYMYLFGAVPTIAYNIKF